MVEVNRITDESRADQAYDERDRVLWTVWSRLIFLSVLATSAICLRYFFEAEIKAGFFVALAVGAILSSASIFAIWKFKELRRFWLGISQIVLDACVATYIVRETGDIFSPFILLYGLNMLAAGIIFFSRGVIVSAVLAVGSILGLLALRDDLFLDPSVLTRSIFVLASLILVAGLVVILFRSREKILKSLERTTSDLQEMSFIQSMIVDHISSGIFISNSDQQIIFENQSARRILGASFRNKQSPDWLRPFAASEVRDEVEVTEVNGQRSLRLLVESVSLGAKGQMIVFNDVTDFRKLEASMRLQDKLASVGQLAAGLAHEIKNPLASLSGSVQMLHKELPEDSSEARLMKIMMRETDRLDELLTNFLNYAKPGRLKISDVKLRNFVEEIFILAKNLPELQKGDKCVSFEAQISNELSLMCDASQMKQVLWNLIKNAIIAVEKKGRILVEAREARRKDFIRVEVKDTGRGIEQGNLDRIFEPFFSKSQQGTGLGLAVVYQIIQSHSGTLGVESKAGEGSLFWFEVPKLGPESLTQIGRSAA